MPTFKGPDADELSDRKWAIKRLQDKDRTGADVAEHLRSLVSNPKNLPPNKVVAQVEDVLSDLTLRRKLRATAEDEVGKDHQPVIDTLATVALDNRMSGAQREKVLEIFRFSNDGTTKQLEGRFTSNIIAKIREVPATVDTTTGRLAPGFKPTYLAGTKVDERRIENFGATLKKFGLLA